MNRDELVRAVARELCLLRRYDPDLIINLPSRGEIPAWKHFAEREAKATIDLVLEEAAKVARNACLVPPDGGAPTDEERLMCGRAADAILALTSKGTAQ